MTLRLASYGVRGFVGQSLTPRVVMDFASAFGTLIFWLFCWGINFTHFRLIAFPVEGISATSTMLLDLGYWIFPKPLDMSGIFFDAMQAQGFSTKPEELTIAQQVGRFHPEASIASSLAFAVALLGFGSYEFHQTDY